MVDLFLWVSLGIPMPIDITNSAPVPIEAYHARLEGRDSKTGKPKILAVRTVDSFPAEYLIAPGRFRREWLRGDLSQIEPGSAKVVLDAVLFTDGSVVGPNQFHLDRYEATSKAVNGEIARAIDGLSTQDALAWLRSKVKQHENDYPLVSVDGSHASWMGWFWQTAAQSFLTVGESSPVRLKTLIEKAKKFGVEK